MAPGESLARLPELTAEELDELHNAIAERQQNQLNAWTASEPGEAQHEFRRKVQILQSLDTAVLEARYSIREVDG